MSEREYKLAINVDVLNGIVNDLINRLAAKCAEVDELKARLAEKPKEAPPSI